MLLGHKKDNAADRTRLPIVLSLLYHGMGLMSTEST